MAKTVSERLAEFRNNKSSYKKEKKDSSVSGRLQSHREIKSYSTINNELDELNSKFETISNGWVDSDTMDSTIKECDDLKTKLTGYANYLKQNDDTENYNSVSELLKSWDNNRESLLNYKNLYKDFDSKKTFNKAKKEYEQFIKTQEEMRAYDTVSGSAYIDDLKSQLSSLEKQKSELDTSYKANGGWTPSSSNYNRPSQSQIDPYREWNAKSSEYAQQIKDLKNEIYQKEKFHKEAIDLKELEGFQEVIKNGDFEEKSQKGSSRDNPSPNINETITKSDGKWYIGIGPLGKKKEIKNILTFVRDNADSMGNVKVDEDFQKMLKANDDEVNLYSYLLETDEKKAQRYLDLLMPTLLDRRSDDLKERLDVPVLKHLMSVAQGMGNYLDSVGIKDYSNDASMVAMQNLQSEAEGLDKYLMGAGQTIGNMLPSIMLSHLTSGLASGLGASTKVASAIGTLTNASSVGISAKGSAYEQKIAEGWNPDDAQTYSTLIGLSEASLETILSGIVGTTGFGPEELLKKADMIDNALLRFSAKSGIRLASEEIEEIAQLYLEPTFEVIVKGGDYDQPTVDELVETAIVTAISTGTLNSPASIGEAVNDFKQTQLGKYLNKNNSVDNLKKMAIAEGINPEGRTSSNYKIGGLFNEVGQRVVERIDSANISKYKSGIASQLVERGETKSNALKIADAIVKKQSGKSLTAEEIKAISSSENGKSVLNDVKASMKGESVAWMDRLATRTTNKLNSAIATKTEFDQLAEKKSNKQNKARANAEGYKVEESATVKPQSISVDSDGKVVIDTENGLQKATEVAVDSNTAIMLGYADDMKGEEKRVFVENFDGKIDADAYYNSFELQKSYAINGASITVGRANKGRLTDSQVLNFYKYGLTQRKSEIAKKQQALDKLVEDFNKEHHEVKEGSFNATAIENVKLNRKQNAVVRIFKALASRGVNVVIENSTAEQRANNFGNGWYDPETNTIHIDLNAGIIEAKRIVKDTMINTMSHELLHWAKVKSPELYEALKDMVLDAMDKSDYNSNTRIIIEMNRIKGKKEYQDLSKDELMDITIEEIVARACEGNLAKSELMTEIINDLSARGEGLLEKFTEAIHEAVKTVMDFLGILDEYADNLSEEAQTMQEVLGQELDAFVKAYDDLVKSALETNQALKGKNNKNSIEKTDKYSDRDTAYMDAVNRGDMETAQRLVDEAAKANGYIISGYHGTDIRFTVFDREKTSTSNDFGKGFYFTSSQVEAQKYQNDDAFGDTYNKIDGIAYDNALERIESMGEDASDDALFTKLYNEEFDKELKRRTDEGATINAYLKMEKPFIVSTTNWITEEEAIDIAQNTMYVDNVPDDVAISDWVHSIKFYAKQHDGKVDTHQFANNMGHSVKLTSALLTQGIYDGILDYSVGTKFDSTADYHAIALYPNKIKDSAPVTYDDNGNVIPLSKRFDNDNKDIRYSDRDIERLETLNNQLRQKQNELYDLAIQLRKFDKKEAEDKLYSVMDKKGVTQEELDDALFEYAEWERNSGYADMHKKETALKDELKFLRREVQKIEDSLHKKLLEQISHFTDEEIQKYVSKAVRRYHTTSRLSNASYLLTTGSMLDFSDGQGYRVKDHREISEILDLPDYAEYSDGMIAFMNMGNIRLQTYGIDISAMPNSKQFSALRDVIIKTMREYDEFTVDFSRKDGHSAGSITYPKGTVSSKIFADIKNFFENGVIPEQESGIRDFLYSDRDIKRIDSEGNELTAEQQEFFKDSKNRDETGRLKVMYHGTPESFTIFDRKKSSPFNLYGRGFYFTNSKSHADQYGNVTKEYYLDIKNPISTYKDDNIITKKQLRKYLEVVAENEDYSIENYGTYDIDTILNSVYSKNKSDYVMIQDISATAIGDLVEAIELFNKVNGTTFDGLILATETVVFRPEQIKSTTNLNPTSNPDIRFSDREVQYTYNNLVSKPDMVITKLAEDISLSRAEIIREAKKNATVIGKKHNDGSISVLVDDIDTDVVISTDSIKHSLDRRIKVNGPVMLQIGKILKNSIKINELNPREDNIKKTYVLIGVAQNTNNEPYIVSFVVNSHTNKIDTVDVLYSANAKKETAVLNAPRDSTPSTVSTISISDLLKYVNKYFPDILPSDVLKHFGYSERPKGKLGESALFSDRDVPSVRSTLVDALDSITESEIDKQTLNKYRAMLDKIEKSSNELAEAKRELHDMMFTKGKYDAEKKKKLEATIKAKENTVNQWDKSLLRLESTKPFKDVVEREKKKAMQKQKVKGKEAMKDYRESVAHRTELKKLTDRAMKLNKWLNENSKDHHIPDALKTPVAELLNALDFSSKRLLKGGKETQKDVSFAERMRKVKDMLNDNSIQDGGMIFLEDGIREDFDKLVDTVGRLAEEHSQTENVLNNMTAEQLHNLNQVLRSITSSIAQANELIANNQYKNAFDCIRQTLKDAYDSPEYKSGSNTKLSKAWRGIKTFINWSNELPYYVFKRFGKGGQSIFEELQDGQDKLAFLEKQVLDFKKETFTDKQVADWEKEIHEFNVDGKTIKVSTAQLMGYYMLSLRKQAQGHLMGCGIAFGDMYDKEAQVYNAHITAEEMVNMFEVLTNEQIEIAKKLQNFMATVCGEWGNKISMARYGIRAFTETDYYPLKVDANEHNSENAIQQEESLYRLLNMSFTKQTNPKANNRVMIYSIFDVFAQHTSDMAKYNAMALPLLDALKWFNFRTTQPNGKDEGSLNSVSVKDALDHAYGKQAQTYVLDLLKDLNSSKGSGRSQMDGFLSKLMSGSKIAMVAFNFRVALLQATSYMWASNEINPLYLLKGLIRLPSIKKAEKYSGIALWKSFGNYDINITRNMTEAIKGKSTKDKLVEITLKGAEWGDKITWGYLWNACESEIKSTTNLKIGTDEFNQAVAKRLREIIYRTQVVDSILTRSPLMRSKDNATKSVTAFMSEPILRYNMVQSQIFKTIQDSKKLGIKTALSKHKGGLTRVVGVYVSSVALTTIVQSLVDALRDDDDEKEFYEKFLEAWKENGLAEITVLSKLPILSDVYSAVLSLVKYGNVYENEPMYTAWITKTIKSVMGWVNLAKDKGKATTYKNLYDTAQAISSLSGLPIGNAMREFVTLWNNTIGVMDENLKIKKYVD